MCQHCDCCDCDCEDCCPDTRTPEEKKRDANREYAEWARYKREHPAEAAMVEECCRFNLERMTKRVELFKKMQDPNLGTKINWNVKTE